MEEAGEFHDWEMLQTSDMGLVTASDSVDKLRDFEGIDGDSDGVIRCDYFALDSEKRYSEKMIIEGDREEGSVDSGKPSWVDPGSESRYGDGAEREVGFEGIGLRRNNSSEFWSDSGSDGSASRKTRGFDGKEGVGDGDDVKKEAGFEGIKESEGVGVEHKNHSKFWSDSGGDGIVSLKSGSFEGICELGYVDDGKSEVGSNSSVAEKFGDLEGEGELGSDDFPKMGEDRLEFTSEGETGNGSEPGGVVEVGKSGGGEKRNMVWWKLPLELLKFCVYRVSPVWSVSIAAAVMGFVILGRRLYKMRRKSRSVPLKVTLDEKKASQFMIRAARLNEAFSVVRRVPIVRSLPASGVTPWPVMGLR